MSSAKWFLAILNPEHNDGNPLLISTSDAKGERWRPTEDAIIPSSYDKVFKGLAGGRVVYLFDYDEAEFLNKLNEVKVNGKNALEEVASIFCPHIFIKTDD